MASDIETYPLEFSGSGGEFFRVWIVNVLLTIVTLGFYTPFARKRTAQYFYGHTLVADSPLEFTAQQRKMVFGFLLVVAVYMLFKLASETGQDTVVSLLLVSGALLAPWLWGSAMRFRLGSTRWRGVRLRFSAGWGDVYVASWPVFVTALSWLVAGGLARVLGKASPVSWVLLAAAFITTVLCIIRLEYNYKSVLVKCAQVGTQGGRWKPVYRDFVRIWLATLGVFIGCVLLVAVLFGVLAFAAGASIAMFKNWRGGGFGAFMLFVVFIFLFIFVLFLASAPARAYREARIFQLVWNNVGVSSIARFRCNLQVGAYVALRVKNIFLSLLTLGFYRPFAKVAEYRMKTESVTLHVKGGLDQLVGQLVRQEGGLGDAAADAVGLDLV